MAHDLIDLRDRKADDPERVGGKSVGLHRLIAMGLPVPSGFVLSAGVLRAAQEEPQILAPKLRDRILRRSRRLGGPVAVRSSLVGEDSAHASLAGQLDSVLDIVPGADGERLFAAIEQCRRSATASRLAAYRRHLQSGESPSGAGGPLRLAVIIQRMRPAQAAGVAFSADPVSGRRCVIIEAAPESAAPVVGGLIEPQRWRVDARGTLVEERINSGEAAAVRLLSHGQVAALATDIRRIEAEFNHPVDVEWAWDGERFWYLQARPVTALADQHIYSNRLVSDMSPGLIKPLLWSTNTLGMARNVFGRIFDELLGPTGVDYERLVRKIHSRLYTDMTLLGELLVHLGLPANFFEVLARDEVGERPRVRYTPRRLMRMSRALPFLVRHLRSRRQLREHVTAQKDFLRAYREHQWSDLDLQALLDQVGAVRSQHGRSQWSIFLAAFNSMVRKRVLDRMVRRHAPDIDPADLIRGLGGLKALEPNRRLRELSRLARDLAPDRIEVLRTEDDTAIRAALAGSSEGGRLLAGFDAFLRDYGFLSANGTDITRRSWCEEPQSVWRIIARGCAEEIAPARDETTQIRREARRRVRSELRPLQRVVFARLLRSTSIYLHLRERISLLHSECAFQLRRLYLAIGDRLVAAGVGATAEDVFFLEIDELQRIARGELGVEEANRSIRRRQRILCEDESVHPPDTVCGRLPVAGLPIDEASNADCLVGIGGSSGVIQGRARIVRDPLSAPPDLGREDILVVPFTDVGWTPLFAGVGGIVAETGGQLSHSAIVAREYNLPAVVSVPQATSLLSEYQPITLDGLAGRVYFGHVLNREEKIS